MIGRRLIFFDKPLQRSNLCASHRQRRWLTHGELINLLERLNEEIKRRTRVVSIFPNPASCLQLVRALCAETHERSPNHLRMS